MITQEQAKELVLKDSISAHEMLDVIQRYIFDKKGVDVGKIINPNNFIQQHLMNIAFDNCIAYYTK